MSETPRNREKTALRQPQNRNVMVSPDGYSIEKVRPHDTNPQKILSYYDKLKSAGVRVGEKPTFTQVSSGEILERSQRIAELDDSFLFASSQPHLAQAFYRETLLNSIKQVVAGQKDSSGNLQFSFDPLPQNFVNGSYIDYDPIEQNDGKEDRRLDSKKLWNYALVKTARLRPELFGSLYGETIAFLEENGLSVDQKYLQERPYVQATKLLQTHLEKEGGRCFNDLSSLVFSIDPFTHNDDLLGLACLFVASMDVGQKNTLSSLFNIPHQQDTNRAIVEEISYSSKANPMHLRKKLLEAAAVLCKPEMYADFNIEEYTQRLNTIEHSITQVGKAEQIQGTILNSGSLVRGKTTAFSDLDYLYFSHGNYQEITTLFSRLGVKFTDKNIRDIRDLVNGKTDETKVKCTVQGVKISFQILGKDWEKKITLPEESLLTGYPPAVMIAKDLDGNNHTMNVTLDDLDFTWKKMDDSLLVGPIIDHITNSWVTYQKGIEGDEIIAKIFQQLATHVKEHTGLTSPSFSYFLRCMYYNHERYFNNDSFERLKNRWDVAVIK